MKEKLSLDLYFHVHERLKDNCDGEGCIDYREVKMRILNIKIPKSLIPKILKDLEKLGLSEPVHKFKFKIKNERDCKRNTQ